jgi:transglutaminase-like putative cysteine protease
MEKNYLESGKQTEITEEIRDIAETIHGEGLSFVANALSWVEDNIKPEKEIEKKNNLFRKRTADQIIKNKFSTGCTDTALAFIAIARAKGIPTKYVEAIDKQWLKSEEEENIKGHVFAECFVDDRWFLIDPTMLLIHAKNVYPYHEIYAEGLDSWDVGIRSFEDLKEKFLAFRAGKNRQ